MTSKMLPLSQIRFGHEAPDAPVNARVTDREEHIAELVASIRAQGLILPLAVRPGSGEDGCCYVIDGNRRLAALRAIAEQDGTVAGTVMVPVLEREGDTGSAFEASLAANIVRVPLHPVDQFEAFARLAQEGLGETDIAERFGVPLRTVRQRLALGRLSPRIRQAWREEQLGDRPAECAMAFTLTEDATRQEKIFDSLTKRGGLWPHAVRRELGAGDRDVGRWLRIAGRDAYLAAGGAIVEDLFGDDHAVSDPGLAERLAAEAIEKRMADLVAEGWAWAANADDLPYSWSYAWEKLKVSKKKATKEQKARSGCVVKIAYDGEIDITYGVVKPEQAKKEKAAKHKDETGEELPPAVSNAMMHRLSIALTTAVQKALPASPQVALAALVAGLICGHSHSSPVRLRKEGFGDYEARRDAEEFSVVFGRLKAMTTDDLLVAAANAMSKTIDMQSHNALAPPTTSEHHAAFFDALDPEAMRRELAEAWNAGDYFGGVSKPLILRAIGEAIGPDEARKAGKLKKKELAQFALANVVPTGWLPPELRTAHYVPPRPIIAEAAE